jgi:hypothetical protein
MLNSVLNYLTNFVSLINVQIYHLPGNINVLADVLSRAISDNLNCNLPSEHPISKQWAAVLPPIPEKFMVDHETIYKFLTHSLKPEKQDLHNRTIRKLNEPKTIQNFFDLSKHYTPEEKFNSAIALLEQWNQNYYKSDKPQHFLLAKAKLEIDLEKQQESIKKVTEIMKKVYDDIKDTPLYKQIHKNLVEASKRFIKASKRPLSAFHVQQLQETVDELLKLFPLLQQVEIKNSVVQTMKSNYVAHNSISTSENQHPTVFYSLDADAIYKPKICPDSNG